MPEEEEPDLEQEEENELVVHLEEDEDLEEEAEEPVGGLFGTKRKRVDNNNSVCKRKNKITAYTRFVAYLQKFRKRA